MNRFLLLPLFCWLFLLPTAATAQHPRQVAEDVELIPLSPALFLHRSYSQTESFGKVGSNGLVHVSGGECLVFDTPMRPDHTEALLSFLEDSLHLQVKGLVVNHFHDDCLGGIEAFHRRGLPSYASELTRQLAGERGVPLPTETFSRRMTIRFGAEKVECYCPGPAHTRDNIVCWLPAEATLFGGCMVKAVDASKGFTGDASLSEWSGTIEKVRQRYGKARLVIPGHGDTGGTELLDYTIRLFQE